MIAVLLTASLSVVQEPTSQRATPPDFQGKGSGRLEVLSVSDTSSLEFYVVRCTQARPGGGTFSVMRSGTSGSPPAVEVGSEYRGDKGTLAFRIETGDVDFAVGDTFSFVTFGDPRQLDELFDRWSNEYVKWIISREERERFAHLEFPAEKVAFIESFWRQRDADPSTPENEFRQAHAQRFAYAVQNFGAGTPGWATDMGKIYILLGPPHSIQRNPAGRTAFERPSEIWTYNNPPNPRLPASMDIGFVDFTGTGRFEIVDASNLDILAPLRTNLGHSMSELEALGLLRSGGTLMEPNTGLRTEIRPTDLVTGQFDFQRELLEVQKIPRLSLPSLSEVTSASAAFPSIPVAAETAFFRAAESEALVPLTLSIPYARLTPRPTETGYRYEVDVLVQVEDGDGAEDVPIQDRLEVSVTGADELAEYRESDLLYEASLALSPGSYKFLATLRDNPSGAVGQASFELQIPELSADRLALSSLILAASAVETLPPPPGGPRAPFQFGNLRLVPNVADEFLRGSPMIAYLQAYGFSLEPETRVGELKVELFILRGGRLHSKVAASYHRPRGEPQTAIKSEIQLKDFPSGEYVLRARVTDERTGAEAEQEASFRVRAPVGVR